MSSPTYIAEGSKPTTLRAVGLFAGIGGFEVGFAQEGILAAAFCERDEAARAVLAARFPGVGCEPDITTMEALPDCDILTAGFPCQDLSPAGPLAGIMGEKSGLVSHVFRLLRGAGRLPDWVIFENVPFMLSHRAGAGIDWLITQIESLGMRWAYRVVDSSAFGLAQRRRRLYIVASRAHDPTRALFRNEVAPIPPSFTGVEPCGFYWTEGNTGLGWAVDSVPPLKGSSGLGIISPPGVWLPNTGAFVAPTIAAAEELQGLPADWTKPAEATPRGDRLRWKLVGNAVSASAAAWLARSIQDQSPISALKEREILPGSRWPKAARGQSGRKFAVEISEWPEATSGRGLAATIAGRSVPLSFRAVGGFYRRLINSTLRTPPAFRHDLARYVEQQSDLKTEGEPEVLQHARAG